MFGILPALGAKPTTDITGDYADILFGYIENLFRQKLSHTVRILHVGMQKITIFPLVIGADGAAGFHVLGEDAGNHKAAADDTVRPGKRRLCRCRVTNLKQTRHIVRTVIPHQRRIRVDRAGGIGNRRQRQVVNGDRFSGIVRLGQRIRNDQRNGITNITNTAQRQRRLWAVFHRFAIRAEPFCRHAGNTEIVGGDIFPGIDGQNTR